MGVPGRVSLDAQVDHASGGTAGTANWPAGVECHAARRWDLLAGRALPWSAVSVSPASATTPAVGIEGRSEGEEDLVVLLREAVLWMNLGDCAAFLGVRSSPSSLGEARNGTVALAVTGAGGETAGMRTRHPRPTPDARSAFAGFRFPSDVIVLAVRWYLRFGLSYRDVEELLTERGVEVDHVTVYRWVVRFAPLLAEAARRFFQRAIGTMRVAPVEVVTDHAPVYPAVLEELLPAASASHRPVRPQPGRSRITAG